MTKKSKSAEQTLYGLGLAAILVIAAACFIIGYLKVPIPGPLLVCRFHELTGLFCLGCGGTRAFVLLFRGRIFASILCHPLVPYGITVFGSFMVSHTLHILTRGEIQGMTYRHIYIKIAVVILIGNFLVKNLAWLLFHTDLAVWAVNYL